MGLFVIRAGEIEPAHRLSRELAVGELLTAQTIRLGTGVPLDPVDDPRQRVKRRLLILKELNNQYVGLALLHHPGGLRVGRSNGKAPAAGKLGSAVLGGQVVVVTPSAPV